MLLVVQLCLLTGQKAAEPACHGLKVLETRAKYALSPQATLGYSVHHSNRTWTKTATLLFPLFYFFTLDQVLQSPPFSLLPPPSYYQLMLDVSGMKTVGADRKESVTYNTSLKKRHSDHLVNPTNSSVYFLFVVCGVTRGQKGPRAH